VSIETVLRALGGFALLATVSCGTGGNPVLLDIDPQCRNGATVTVDGEVWYLVDGDPPVDWQDSGTVMGAYERLSDSSAVIRVGGEEFELASGANSAVCESW